MVLALSGNEIVVVLEFPEETSRCSSGDMKQFLIFPESPVGTNIA